MKEFLDQPQSDSNILDKANDKLKKFDVIEKMINGKQKSIDDMADPRFVENYDKIKDMRSVMADALFTDINPLGIPLDDLKQNMEQEMIDLQSELRMLPYETISDEEKVKKYDEYIEKINYNQEWVTRIRDYLVILDWSNPLEDAKETAEYDLERLKRIVEIQRNPNQN
ncbi:MAG: hypothetical protein WCG20_03755 [bacterium]